MGERRQSRSELPHAPLALVHPLSVPGAEVDGAALLAELPRELAAPALQLLRAVLAWSRDPAEAAAALDAAAMARLERRLLDRPRVQAPWAPLAVLAEAMGRPLTANPDQVAPACLAVCDWAVGEGAESTALAFAEAAALAWPGNARFAWVAGRMLREHGRMKHAERWLRRAHRVAVWTDDWESQARSLNSLGNVHYARGGFAVSRNMNTRALQLASRETMKKLEGEIRHDLFVIHAETGEADIAEMFASTAFEAYFPSHPRLPYLVHDVAQFWNEQGKFTRSLPILRALLCRLNEPGERLRTTAALARAAGGLRDFVLFEATLQDALRMAGEVHEPASTASAFFEIGLGGIDLSSREHAVAALDLALEHGAQATASDVVIRASEAMERAQRLVPRARSVGCAPACVQAPMSDTFVANILNYVSSSTTAGPSWTAAFA
jgi:tetratricopeptide (TPR) repeat protein